MTWEYRAIEKKGDTQSVMDDPERYYEIHEVYYDQDECIKAWSKNSISAMGHDDAGSLIKDLEAMKKGASLSPIKESELKVGVKRNKTL